jgi:hypothetical protein
MKKVIIPQKMSGTGTIHDIASQHYDREIKFPKGAKFAVVLASYYGGRGYTTHASESATIQADRRQKEFSRQIIGVDGWIYDVDMSRSYDGELRRYLDQREPYEVQDFEEVTQAASALGSSRSQAKAEAAARNGRKGGRPKKL